MPSILIQQRGSTMNLEEIQNAWEILDKRLAEQNRLALQTLTDNRIDRAKSALWPLVFALWAQMLFGVALAIPFVTFWLRHLDTFHLAIAGILVQAYALMMIIDAGSQLALIRLIDHGKPVLEIQTTLAKLRDWRARKAPWLYGITGCLIWIPFLLVVFAALGADLWVKAPTVVNWLLLNAAISLAGFCLLQWLILRKPRSWLARSFDESNTSKSLIKAWKFLEELEQFQKEEETDGK